jgi:hypothetical protein
MHPRQKKFNLQAMLFMVGLGCGYALGSLWPGFFLILLLPFGFRSKLAESGDKRLDLSYLVACTMGLSTGFLLSFVQRITSL